jgi:hypothetical protein
MGEPWMKAAANATGQMERQRPSAKEAATDLARLIERELGYNEGRIDPIALRLFIQARWKRLAALAHTIHGGGG